MWQSMALIHGDLWAKEIGLWVANQATTFPRTQQYQGVKIGSIAQHWFWDWYYCLNEEEVSSTLLKNVKMGPLKLAWVHLIRNHTYTYTYIYILKEKNYIDIFGKFMYQVCNFGQSVTSILLQCDQEKFKP